MGMGVVQPSFGPINSAKSPVQSLPSPVMPYAEMPGKIDPPGVYPPSPPQPPQARSGYYSGSMRSPMGYYQAPNRPYGGGKGGGLPPFAVPFGGGFGGRFGGGFGGYRGPTYAQPMFQPQPSFNPNQGPFGGGQFRRNFGSYNHMAMSGTGPGSQMYGYAERLPAAGQPNSLLRVPENRFMVNPPGSQGPFPLPQIANAYQGPMGMGQPLMDTSQQVQRMSAEDAYKQAQIDAQKSRASGNMGRVVLPGEMKFEDFEKNYNLPQQQLLEAVGTGTPLNQGQVQLSGSQQDLRPELLKDVVPLTQQEIASFNRGNAFGGLGQLVRSRFFR